MPQTKKQQSIARMNAFAAQVRAELGPKMGSVLPSAWLRSMTLAKRVYGLSRRKSGDELVLAAAQAGP